jgi:hypothetical protein
MPSPVNADVFARLPRLLVAGMFSEIIGGWVRLGGVRDTTGLWFAR